MSELSESFSAFSAAQDALKEATDALAASDGSDTTLYSIVDQALANLSVASEALVAAGNANEAASTAAIEASAVADAVTETNNLLITQPVQLTRSGGGNEHARMAAHSNGDIWLAWHSKRTGSEEVYVTKYFGGCGIWDMPGQGGEELKISNFGQRGARAMFPAIAVDSKGEAHVVFQGEIDGRWEVFYSRSTGGGAQFTPPIRLTRSDSNSLAPDITTISAKQDFSGSAQKIVVVWHDDRFGSFEIMSAQKSDGRWTSSGQAGSDIRITSAAGDSLFPRIDADAQGNARVVYHDSRRGRGQVGIYMSTFVALSDRWSSSAQGGADRLISNSPSDALHPDVAIDHTGGTAVAWHDLRHTLDNPDQHEEIYALYCPRMGHPGGVHFPPLQPNIEARLDVDFNVVDCVDFQPISLTNAPEVCLAIRAPGATFWRAANEDGVFTDWQQFRPNMDLETTVVPWTLTCVGGQKKICVQVQDAEMVGFPICKNVTLAMQPPKFKIEFFEDEALTVPLATYKGRPVTKAGDVFVKLTSDSPQLIEPTFEVISRGQHLIFNQETEVIASSGFSGASSAGIGSFIGSNVDIPREDDVSPAAKSFSAAIGRVFKARFNVKKDDGLLHLDGLSRLIATGQDVCGPVKASTEALPVASAPGGGQDPNDFTSANPPPQVIVPDLNTACGTTGIFTYKSGIAAPDFSHWMTFGNAGSNVLSAPSNYAVAAPFRLLCRAKIDKVRAKILRLDGGAGNQTIIAHVMRGGGDSSRNTTYMNIGSSISAVGVPTGTAGALPTDAGTVGAIALTEIDFGGVATLEPGNYVMVFREGEIDRDSSTSTFVPAAGGFDDQQGYFKLHAVTARRAEQARVPVTVDAGDVVLDRYAFHYSLTGAPRSNFELDTVSLNSGKIRWNGLSGYHAYMEIDFIPA